MKKIERITKFVTMKKVLVEGEDFYLSDRGYRVFTEKYLLDRGFCCMSGCKHCPYGFNKLIGQIRKAKNKNNDV